MSKRRPQMQASPKIAKVHIPKSDEPVVAVLFCRDADTNTHVTVCWDDSIIQSMFAIAAAAGLKAFIAAVRDDIAKLPTPNAVRVKGEPANLRRGEGLVAMSFKSEKGDDYRDVQIIESGNTDSRFAQTFIALLPRFLEVVSQELDKSGFSKGGAE